MNTRVLTAWLRALRSGLYAAILLLLPACLVSAHAEPGVDTAAWQRANARVAELGGWKTYAREPLPPESGPCLVAQVSGEVLTAVQAQRIAVAPQDWPPPTWETAEGRDIRVVPDAALVERATRARHLWLDAVFADSDLRLAGRHYAAADATADLATRAQQVGNLPAAEALPDRIARAHAAIACHEANQTRLQARLKLAELLGRGPDALGTLVLPEQLPPLPPTPMSMERQRALLVRSRQSDPATPLALQLKQIESRYQHAWEIAQLHVAEILPAIAQLREESVLRYNGMLIGPDALLKVAREAIEAERAALAALAAFWHADATLQAALMGQPDTGE